MSEPELELVTLAGQGNSKAEYGMRVHVLGLTMGDTLPRLQMEQLYHVYCMPSGPDEEHWQVVLTSDLYHLFSLEMEEQKETKQRVLVSRITVSDTLAKNRENYLGRLVAKGASLFDAAWNVYKYLEVKPVAHPGDAFVKHFLGAIGFGNASISPSDDSKVFGILGEMASLLKGLLKSFYRIVTN